MKLLDRYVLRNFMEPFFMSFGGFMAIWIIFDISDNSSDFIDAKASIKQIALYYVTQLPQYTLVCLPVGLLLALLYSLTRMSRSNELISMLTAGRSVFRVLIPLLGVGLATSAFCLWLNWDKAPHAEGIKKVAIGQIKKGRKIGDPEPINAHLFRDRQNNRTWYVKRLRLGTSTNPPRMADVHITQQEPDGRITCKWYASSASYDAERKTWKLDKGIAVQFTLGGDIEQTQNFLEDSMTITDWTETPWRVASSELDAQALSVPELHDYLHYNGDFPEAQLAPYRANLADRYALPISCLVVVLIGAPLGIIYNRRGVAAAVAGALSMLCVLILSRYFFMALGKGMRINPMLAPWVPDIVLGSLGLILLWFRSTNRDLPNLAVATGRATIALLFGVLLVGTGGYLVYLNFPQSLQITGPIWKNVPYNCVISGGVLVIYGFIARRPKLRTARA